ncbi:glycoside hydrolase family 3 N-terminal domain-containing protein [Azospirillum endophyticum]
MRSCLWWGMGILLVGIGINVNHPFLAAPRGWLAPALVAAGLAGLGMVLLRGARRNRWHRRGLAAVWVAVPLSCLGSEGVFLLHKATVLSAPAPLATELGQHFMIGYTRSDEVETLAARGLIGGIFISRRNLAGRTAQDLRDEIRRLQESRRRAGLPPLRVATDQEGGIVSKLSPWLPWRPSPSTLADLPPAERRAAARRLGADHGRDLSSLGVTVNFAPVLDLRNDRPPDPLDINSQIARRAISDDPAVVWEVAAAYAGGLLEAGVRPTVKHFPGLGRADRDTHLFPAEIRASRETLEPTDWQPFRRVLSDNPRAMLMVGHAVLSAVDSTRPASLSRPVIDGLIRRDWGFDGLVVTDDLVMGPVYGRGLCGSVTDALNAGVDLLLIAYDGKQFYRAMACALDAGMRDGLDGTALAASRRRLEQVPADMEADTAATSPYGIARLARDRS